MREDSLWTGQAGRGECVWRLTEENVQSSSTDTCKPSPTGPRTDQTLPSSVEVAKSGAERERGGGGGGGGASREVERW